MPLTDEQRMEMKAMAAAEAAKQIAEWGEKIMAIRPEPGTGAPMDMLNFILGVGAVWYSLLGGLKQTRGEAYALKADAEANVAAAIITPGLVDFHEAAVKAMQLNNMLDPKAKG